MVLLLVAMRRQDPTNSGLDRGCRSQSGKLTRCARRLPDQPRLAGAAPHDSSGPLTSSIRSTPAGRVRFVLVADSLPGVIGRGVFRSFSAHFGGVTKIWSVCDILGRGKMFVTRLNCLGKMIWWP